MSGVGGHKSQHLSTISAFYCHALFGLSKYRAAARLWKFGFNVILDKKFFLCVSDKCCSLDFYGGRQPKRGSTMECVVFASLGQNGKVGDKSVYEK